MRRAARVDANQARIVKALRLAGCMVQSLAPVGDGVPDLLVGCKGVLHLVETKNGDRPPCKRKLTDKQVKFHEAWRGYPIHVAKNEIEALDAVGVEWNV